MEREKIRQMVEICQLYYLEGYNQQQLAKRFNISRPQISRIIRAAKEEGIVEMTIHNPLQKERIIEQELIDQFGIQDAIVVDTENMTSDQAVIHLAKAAALHLEKHIHEHNIIGVMAGKSVQQVVQQTKKTDQENVHVIPLVGGLGIQGANWHANSNVIQLSENMNFDYYVLNAPAMVSSIQMKSQLTKEDDIKKVFDLYPHLQIAVVGIGEITEEATFFKTMNLSHEDLKKIKDAGAVCSIGKTLINGEGEEVVKQFSERMIGIPARYLKETPLVIGIAAGNDKVDAIRASLLGKWIDVLVTDVQTGNII